MVRLNFVWGYLRSIWHCYFRSFCFRIFCLSLSPQGMFMFSSSFGQLLHWLIVASSTRIFAIFDEKSRERYLWPDWTTHSDFELSKNCHWWPTHAKVVCSLPCWTSFSPSTWWCDYWSLTSRATASEFAFRRWHWPVHFGSCGSTYFLCPRARWTKSRLESDLLMVRNVHNNGFISNI